MTDKERQSLRFKDAIEKLLNDNGMTAVIHYGHFGRYFIAGRWKPRDEIVSLYFKSHTDANMRESLDEIEDNAKSFAASCQNGAIYAAIYEELDDKYCPYMKQTFSFQISEKYAEGLDWELIYEQFCEKWQQLQSRIKTTVTM